MTLLLPTILYSTINIFIKIMDVAAYAAEYIKQELPGKLISWLSYLFFLAIIAVLSYCQVIVSSFTAIPIYSWTLFWHPDGRSIFDMLRNPEGNGRLFGMITIAIVSAGENARDLCHDGHSVHIFVESGHTCLMRKKHFQSKDMTQDFVCSLTIRSIRWALTRLLEVHRLKMASLVKSLKRHAIRVFEQDFICLLVPSCFARHVPRHHTADLYLRLWSLFPH